jgi:hypothetical protein
MAVLDIAIVVVLVVLVIALVHAANVLSANPHQQVKAHEDLAGPMPSDMTFLQKLDLIDRFGISPTRPSRIRPLIVSLCAVLALLVWQS